MARKNNRGASKAPPQHAPRRATRRRLPSFSRKTMPTKRLRRLRAEARRKQKQKKKKGKGHGQRRQRLGH